MKVSILIVEDEVLVAEDLASDLEAEGYNIAGIAISGDEAIALYQQHHPDLILMDINIKGDKDGIETAKIILENNAVPIIYITSNTGQNFIRRVVQTKPHAFLTKPYNKNDLLVSINLAIDNYTDHIKKNKQKDDAVFVKKGEYHIKIPISEIIYIEADGSYCNVYTKDRKYSLSYNLNHFNTVVNSEKLERTHRSFVVNLDYVDGFDRNSLLLGEKVIPVSSSYKEVFEHFKRL